LPFQFALARAPFFREAAARVITFHNDRAEGKLISLKGAKVLMVVNG